MPPPASPAVAQLELTTRIRSRRQELGLKAREISTHLGFSPNYWSAVENDRTMLSESKLQELVELFDCDEQETTDFLELHDIARRPRWWTRYDTILDDDLMHLYGLEYGAEWIETYEGLLITGLLQTEDYASAVISASPDVSPNTTRQRLEFRKRRQQRLKGEGQLRLTVVMGQAAIMQEIGGSAVLREQLQHLAGLIEQLGDSLEVRIVPFEARTIGMAGASTMHLMHFATEYLPVMAWRESVTPIGLTMDPEEVETISVSYDQARRLSSLSREDSLLLVEQRVRDLEP